jgi:PAS domain S-box-containing protein
MHCDHARLGRLVKRSPKPPARPPSDDPLLMSEEWLRLAIQGSPMGLWYWNEETQHVYWDEKSCEIFDVSPNGEKTADTFYDRLHPDDVERVREVWRYQLEHRLPCDVEYRVVRPDGSIRWIHARGSGYYDTAGNPLRVVGVHFDVTEREKADRERLQLSGRLIDTQEQERTRIGRELHDDIVQRLALVAVELQQLHENSVILPDVRSRMSKLHKQISEIAADTQSLSHELHSAKLQYLGIAVAMRGFCREFGEQQKVEIDFQTHDLPSPLSPDISLCFFRVLQEALHNSVKHSGVRHFEVRLWGTSDEIHLTVSDSGAGFDREAAKTSRGLGLISMEERLKLLNGTLSIDSQFKRGTTVHARVPLNAEGDSLLAAG